MTGSGDAGHRSPRRGMRRLAGLALLLALLAAWLLFDRWMLRNMTPGAGQSYQQVPDRVPAGAAFTVTLRLGVWGAGGAPDARYSDVRFHLQDDAGGSTQTWLPSAVRRDGERMAYRFDPVAPAADGFPLRYHFTFVFDGRPRRTEGLKPIALAGP